VALKHTAEGFHNGVSSNRPTHFKGFT